MKEPKDKYQYNAITNFSDLWVTLSCGKRQFQAFKLNDDQASQMVKWLKENFNIKEQ